MEITAMERTAFPGPDSGPGTDAPRGGETLGLLTDVVSDCAHKLQEWTATAEGASFQPLASSWEEAVGFAREVEGLSRVVESLQLRAAAAVQAEWSGGGDGRESPGPLVQGLGVPEAKGLGAEMAKAHVTKAQVERQGDGTACRAGRGARGAEFRNPAECLRGVLRIGISEARRRLALAGALTSRQALSGEVLEPALPLLARAVAGGELSSRTATIISMALDSVQYVASGETREAMEESLVCAARQHDQDAVRILSRRWVEGLNQDGDEPSEEELARRQGAFVRKAVRGLHHLEIFATTEQFEHLLTVMNAHTNPRLENGDGGAANNGEGCVAEGGDPGSGARAAASGRASDGAVAGDSGIPTATAGPAFRDPRSRAQKLLEGLVGACRSALASGGLPRNGGLRPQVMVTIPYDRLFDGLNAVRRPGDPGGGARNPGVSTQVGPHPRSSVWVGPRSDGSAPTGVRSDDSARDSAAVTRRLPDTGSFVFTGPVNARTIRKLACDAELIPVVLGGEGQVLDIGRASRVFPPSVRKALVVRDQGCAFPGCTMPAPWCEAHHIDYWSHGGPTSTGNGVLLCSYHHHVIHKEQWEILMRSGVPWFVPPPYVDPKRTPQRNHCSRRRPGGAVGWGSWMENGPPRGEPGVQHASEVPSYGSESPLRSEPGIQQVSEAS